MATFNQDQMTVHGSVYQADTINIGQISNMQDVHSAIQELRDQLALASREGAIDLTKGQAVTTLLDHAAATTRTPQADKNVIREKLEAAASLLKDTAAVAGLFAAITKLAGMVGALL